MKERNEIVNDFVIWQRIIVVDNSESLKRLAICLYLLYVDGECGEGHQRQGDPLHRQRGDRHWPTDRSHLALTSRQVSPSPLTSRQVSPSPLTNRHVSPSTDQQTVGWVDFALFLEFHEKSWVCGSPRYNMGNYQIFLILIQKPVRATSLKVRNFKKNPKKNKIFFENVFFNAYIILEGNQILNKTFFWYFFIFKKEFFQLSYR